MRWHYLMWGTAAIIFTVAGALIHGAADVMADRATVKARDEILMTLPVAMLTQLPVISVWQ